MKSRERACVSVDLMIVGAAAERVFTLYIIKIIICLVWPDFLAFLQQY